jgi:flagellar biogenesis protein FliO
MPPARATAPSEFAPDPPGLLDPHAQTAAYQEDSASPTKRQVDKAKPIQSAREATAKPLPTTPRPEAPPPANPKPSASATVAPTTTTAVAIQPAQAEAATPMVVGSHNDKSAPGKGSPLSAMITVGGSLAIVLGLFLVIAWAMRKAAPRGSLVLPKEVFAILGRAPLGARQQVQLLRCGNKLLLVSITPNGVETLTEITEPLEVDRIAGICQQSDPKSSTTSFRQVFQQLAPASGKPPELDNLEPSPARRKRYHWEDKNA